MARASFYFIDSFSREAFQGNPSPVCLLEKSLEADQMLLLAKEFKAPVTAFVQASQKSGRYAIRYFTVEGEIPACGHATLASAQALFQKKSFLKEIVLVTKENRELRAQRGEEHPSIQYPKFGWTDHTISEEMLEALGLDRYMTTLYSPELEALFVEVPDTSLVWNLNPDFLSLKNSSDTVKELVVMGRAEEEGYDFMLRSFCPWIGIDEDPVTGSIHSVLGPYWEERLLKSSLKVYQASARGGGGVCRGTGSGCIIGWVCQNSSFRRTHSLVG